MLRLFLTTLSIVLLAALPVLAENGKKLSIGMLDSPIRKHDLDNPLLNISHKFLHETKFPTLSGEEKSLEELNVSNLEMLDKIASHADMSQWQTYLLLMDLRDYSISRSPKIQDWLDNYVAKHFPDKIKEYIDALGAERSRSHGAEVGSVMTVGLKSFRLLPMSFVHLEPLIKGGLEKLKDSAALEHALMELADRISKTIQKEGIRVFNFSVGSNDWAQYEELEEEFGRPKNAEEKAVYEKIALEHPEIMRRALHRIVADNPQTLFVFAAGNGGRDLSEYKVHTSRIKAPNAIVVGSIHRDGTLASMSDYSAEYVDLYAWGERVLIPGKPYHRSGTSYSAPWVARQAAQILHARPELSPSQVKSELLGKYTSTVKGRRVLSLDEKLITILKEDYEAICELFLTRELPPL